jgi:CRISPR-associated DxTHG motif protein
LLTLMAETVQPWDTVHLDVTHGFRHLPMLALLAALYLQYARKPKWRASGMAPSTRIPGTPLCTT